MNKKLENRMYLCTSFLTTRQDTREAVRAGLDLKLSVKGGSKTKRIWLQNLVVTFLVTATLTKPQKTVCAIR